MIITVTAETAEEIAALQRILGGEQPKPEPPAWGGLRTHGNMIVDKDGRPWQGRGVRSELQNMETTEGPALDWVA